MPDLITILLILLILVGAFVIAGYVNSITVKKEFVFTNSGYEERIERLEKEVEELKNEK